MEESTGSKASGLTMSAETFANELIEAVLQGYELVLRRDGKPIAKLVAVHEKEDGE